MHQRATAASASCAACACCCGSVSVAEHPALPDGRRIDLNVIVFRALGVPVPFLSGVLDPVAPPDWAAAVAAHFPHATQIVVPQGGHALEGMTGMEQCVDAIVLQFVAQRSALAFDSGCVQSMDPGPFALQ